MKGTTKRISMREQRVLRAIDELPSVVVLRSDLAHLGSPAHLTRILAKLVATKALVRVGVGIFAKTKLNRFTHELTPAAPFETIAAEAFRRLGIAVGPGVLAREYNDGKTTQIPMQPIVDTGRRRISRRIQVGSKTVVYERSTSRAHKKGVSK